MLLELAHVSNNRPTLSAVPSAPVRSTADDFEPFSFGCATINARGDIAFKAGRLASDGFNTIPGIYRVKADGSLTTIAEDAKRFVTLGFNPSMNDLGQVSFAARIDGAMVQNLTFCEEGLSDSGQLGFIAQLEDSASPTGFRMVVFRATPAE